MDPDLNSLLDDALSDFDKLAPEKQEKDTTKTDVPASSTASASNSCPMQPPTDVFKEFFDDETTQQLQAEWHQAIRELSEESPELMEEMKKMSAAPQNSELKNENKSTAASSKKPDFEETMKAALESLSLDADKEEEDDELLNGLLNFGGSSAQNNPMGMMENLMKTMLSKEMLYPPMKEMCNRYPDWLEKNSSKISATDKNRYTQQLRCLNSVCKEFEDEKPTDSESVQKERFTRVMDIIHEMQGYGQPPEELIESGGNPIPPPDGCSIS
uniref:Peroxisomal biogenesis factor 19 n=1 Tax=Phallusia mammillata TaxID=59560 RepID=A0A6F9DP68_9ASCI|nr:peroxisomal biogenesis factor 19-like [Phallusia mammillata]